MKEWERVRDWRVWSSDRRCWSSAVGEGDSAGEAELGKSMYGVKSDELKVGTKEADGAWLETD